jgi:hypothetical protein
VEVVGRTKAQAISKAAKRKMVSPETATVSGDISTSEHYHLQVDGVI